MFGRSDRPDLDGLAESSDGKGAVECGGSARKAADDPHESTGAANFNDEFPHGDLHEVGMGAGASSWCASRIRPRPALLGRGCFACLAHLARLLRPSNGSGDTGLTHRGESGAQESLSPPSSAEGRNVAHECGLVGCGWPVLISGTDIVCVSAVAYVSTTRANQPSHSPTSQAPCSLPSGWSRWPSALQGACFWVLVTNSSATVSPWPFALFPGLSSRVGPVFPGCHSKSMSLCGGIAEV